jgi:hypothetical protein
MDILELEFASREEIRNLFGEWNSIVVRNSTLFQHARLNTEWDFVFIIAYVSVMIMMSYTLLQLQPHPGWNNALRFCMLLAVLAGISDVIENSVLLYDMNSFIYRASDYYSPAAFAVCKFILIGFIICCWLGSLIVRKAVFSSHNGHR